MAETVLRVEHVGMRFNLSKEKSGQPERLYF